MQPLDDIRIVDFSRLAPGPMATMILADLGADVTKIEEPGGSRRSREESALSKQPNAQARRWRRISPLERNKRSICINLRTEAGREIAIRVAGQADVVVEGYRPGVMARLGLDYPTLRLENPGLIYCSITGYGQTGRKAMTVGHDLNYLAYSGALSLIGTRDGEPIVPINLLGDYSGGSFVAVIAILSALIERSASGEGQFIDVSMVDSLIGLLGVEIARLIHTGRAPVAGTTYLTGGMAYYNIYRTKDGAYLTIACNEPHFFRELCEILDLNELPPLQFIPSEQGHMTRKLAQRFLGRTLNEWSELLDDTHIPIAGVRSLDQVLADEDLRQRGMFADVPNGPHRPITQAASPFHFSRSSPRVRRLAALPGSDTMAIMRQLGYDDDTVEGLLQDGVIATSKQTI